MTADEPGEVAGNIPPALGAAGDMLGLGRPLTERILGRLGRPRWLWIALWASTAVVAPLLLLGLLALSNEQGRLPSVPDLMIAQLSFSGVVAVCLWGVGRLTNGATAMDPHLRRITAGDGSGATSGGVGTVAGPLVLTAVISIVNTAGTASRYDLLPALVVAPLLAASLLAVMTFVWTYLQLLVGLDRLGRRRLLLDEFPQDRSLGLEAVGSHAFQGFVILFAAAIPILVTSTTNLLTVAINLTVVAVLVAMFFVSMLRLHRQMATAKAAFVANARTLYAAAYAPLRGGNDEEILRAQAPALSAAHELLERAERILTWPLSEGLTAWMAVIVTGVVTSLIVRLVFLAAGL